MSKHCESVHNAFSKINFLCLIEQLLCNGFLLWCYDNVVKTAAVLLFIASMLHFIATMMNFIAAMLPMVHFIAVRFIVAFHCSHYVFHCSSSELPPNNVASIDDVILNTIAAMLQVSVEVAFFSAVMLHTTAMLYSSATILCSNATLL